MHASMTSTKTGEHYLGAYIPFKRPTNVNLSWCFPTTLWSSKVATLVERTPPSGCISKEKKRRLAQDKYNLTNGNITTGTNREQGKQQKVQIERQCQKVPWVKASEAVKASQGFKKSNVNMNKQYEHTYLSQGLLQPWMKSTKDTKTFDCHEAGKKKCQRPLSKRKHL